jgi:hypothetical protein
MHTYIPEYSCAYAYGCVFLCCVYNHIHDQQHQTLQRTKEPPLKIYESLFPAQTSEKYPGYENCGLVLMGMGMQVMQLLQEGEDIGEWSDEAVGIRFQLPPISRWQALDTCKSAGALP